MSFKDKTIGNLFEDAKRWEIQPVSSLAPAQLLAVILARELAVLEEQGESLAGGVVLNGGGGFG